MDVLAHSLWTNIMYRAIPVTRQNKKTTWWGIFFGVFPDIVAFTPVWAYLFYGLFTGAGFRFVSPEDGGVIPLSHLTYQLYNISHSLVVWAAVFGLTWLIMRRVPWVLLGWALHIGIDIFSHSTQFFPTPFLWPVANFHVNGWSWGTPVFMAVNYGALLVLYIFLVPKLKQKFGK